MSARKLSGGKTLAVGGILEEFSADEAKRRVDLVSLFSHFGVELAAKGKSHTGCCPFHDDSTPSLSVDREKGLYHCFGCGEAGDAITLVRSMKGCEFAEAVRWLTEWAGSATPAEPASGAERRNGHGGAKHTGEPSESAETSAKTETGSGETPKPEPVSLDAVSEVYEAALSHSEKAQSYLKSRGLTDPALWRRFRVGYAEGNLSERLSKRQKAALTEQGIFTERGREAMRGCITVPLFDEQERVAGFYGRAIAKGAKPQHRYLAGPHRGLVNRRAAAVYRDELILTESVIDALSLIGLGVENTIPCYGTNGFSELHEELLRENRVETVVLAFDADEAGREAVGKLTERLLAAGHAVKVIEPPAEHPDWNAFLCAGGDGETVKQLIAETERSEPEREETDDLEVTDLGHKRIFTTGGVSYRLLGLRELFVSSLRVNIRAESAEAKYIDNADLYSAKSRSMFAQNAGRALGSEPSRIERDLLRILEYLEAERDARFAEDTDTEPPELSETEREAGMALLRDPEIFSRIPRDLERLGYVGEELNKLLVYLAATSRRLADPLSVLVISESAAGKSFLIDTVKRLMPAEEVVSITSLSDQALNYLGEDGLLHKFLVMGEAVHSEQIEHQVREMLSAKELSRLVAVKDPKTGVLRSETVRKPVVVSCAMSTTNPDVNPENASRFFLIHADESREQTARIHAVQRRKYALSRYREAETAEEIIRAHQAAQRLLRDRRIINPFAEALSFPQQAMRSRRDHERFLDLIAACSFLRQYQKEEQETEDASGNPIRYIESDLTDYAAAYRIMTSILSATLSAVPERAHTLYEAARRLAREKAHAEGLSAEEVSFTQRELREQTGLNHTAVKRTVRLLCDYEYLIPTGFSARGHRRGYKLLADEALELVGAVGIPSPEEVEAKLEKLQSGSAGSDRGTSGSDPLFEE
jgi:hypothetical protein